jgi:hypothetical protein
MPIDEARAMVRNGHAKWVHQCRGIRLNYKPKSVMARGVSCRVNHRVMLGVVWEGETIANPDDWHYRTVLANVSDALIPATPAEIEAGRRA